MSGGEILDELFRNPVIDDIIQTITSGKLKDDLKGELFLILCEMDESKIKKAHNGHYLIYFVINILKKQYHSKSSPFHMKFRKVKHDDWVPIDSIKDMSDGEAYNEDLLNDIRVIVEKLPMLDKELFKLYYKWDRYDRWIGDLRDTECQKEMSSYRKIEKKLTVKGSGKKIAVSRTSISQSHKRSIEKIKKELGI